MKRRRNLINVRIGAKLRSAREKRGLAQAFVAAKMGIMRTSLINIEYGRQGISAAQLHKFGEIYGVSVCTFWEGI